MMMQLRTKEPKPRSSSSCRFLQGNEKTLLLKTSLASLTKEGDDDFQFLQTNKRLASSRKLAAHESEVRLVARLLLWRDHVLERVLLQLVQIHLMEHHNAFVKRTEQQRAAHFVVDSLDFLHQLFVRRQNEVV